MKTQYRRRAALLALALLASAAQAAPEALKMVVPFAAGGPADQIARIVAQPLGQALGRPVIVDNRGGAGGTVGANYAAKSAPDGNTILLSTSALVLSAGTTPHLPVDARKDLVPVYLLGEVQTLLAVRPTLGVSTLAELTAKARAGSLNYGSTGVGGTMHVGAELYASTAGVKMVHIPYRGAAPAIVDLMAGNVDLVNADVPVLKPFVADGRIKPIVIFDTRRSPLLPEVPTAAEAGMPALQLTNWYGVLVPAGSSKAFVQQLAAALAQVVGTPEVAARLAEAGFSHPAGSAAFQARLDADFQRWLPWLRAAHIQTE
ncbi:tripartite tricarboxylate transporter substrate binding protein [Xylophilus rhododendri]|uniref:Tripartite tricarboxylate transporter substrate binding protein n=1 Tax=Xylophilus rhododendri TaxID=2697032 RepID=A0A857J349_9BURK|nr:tripartite tricarboxylate transporter substrate-binding protein [Xylophilus rhododendri]QHI98350.1 tripartite tricarboxylate transporter substrate binding protein [Xylophilus rhododendri]